MNKSASGLPIVEREQDALEWLDRSIEHARSWLVKCEEEVEAFRKSYPELKPILERWEQDRDHTALMLHRYEALSFIVSERAAWKAQHENLLSVRQSDLTALEAARYRWQELCRRALTYLQPTLGITKEIRAALPPYDEEREINAAGSGVTQ